MINKTDTVLFDLDDTLIRELKSAEDSFIETIKQLNSQIDIEKFVKEIRKQAREEWYKLPTIDYCLKIGISSWEALWADFTGDFGELPKLRELASGYRFRTWSQALTNFGFVDPELAQKLSLDFKRIRDTKHILYPEASNILTSFKNKFKLGLITNGAPDLQWKKINGGNLKHYFDFIAISGEHGFAKPDKRLFDVVLNGLKSTKEGAVMIGDTLSSDIKGAKDYGIKTIWINRNGADTNEIRPDYEIRNLSEIQTIIH